MSSMVSGYSGIIAPPNLATNGAFKINQRASIVNGAARPISVGDYVCDAWKIDSNNNNFDYTVATWHTNGWLKFQGYGKKGQRITLRNKDTSGFGHQKTASVNQTPLSSSVVLKHVPGSIPVRFAALPRWGVHHTVDQEVMTNCVIGGSVQSKPSIFKGDSQPDYTYGGSIHVELLEDGDFYFLLHGYIEIHGSYKNPPQCAPVPYADDLARCQRYYQKFHLMSGGYAHAPLPVNHYYNGYPLSETSIRAPLQQRMSATPSVSFDIYNNQVQEFKASTRTSTTDLDTRWTISTPAVTPDVVFVSFRRNTQDSSILAMNISMSLIAEVV